MSDDTYDPNCEAIAPLISGALDNELTQQQHQQLHLHLAGCAKCSKVYQELSALRGTLKADFTHRQQQQLVTESNGAQRVNLIAWWVLLICGLILAGAGVVTFWFGSDSAMWLKVVMSLVGFSLLVLFLNVLKQRLQQAKSDPYTKVKL
ncbi:zf-HC2 domain-containing protein [Pseudidiomarina sediminum]|uniref:zf-HC2 domain-containing protein n=1 Tax=Pseudidiomarina sediminum TaxID=431675 RepID=UPI001C961C18|nr:zf-HC2 domain-containing protein [Pseudidiomarina sediminum]MBY6063018.1 zf-HC2 domain-containing protein [Pseudidiomarina sediminum]